jgi:4'-phosphopantetheinyl transferase
MSMLFPVYDYEDIVVENGNRGAPYIQEMLSPHISISHSNEYAVGGISLNTNIDLGLDIEKIEPRDLNAFNDVAFTENELSNYIDLSDTTICKNWTIKEAYLKFLKQGFNINLKRLEVIDDTIIFDRSIQDNINVLSKQIDETYQLSVVYNDILDAKEQGDVAGQLKVLGG